MKEHLFFVDAETDGLYGNFLTVAVAIVNSEFEVIEQYYWGIEKENLHIESQWVKENVLPILGDYSNVENENELLESFWRVWLRHRDTSYAIANVISPVEARLFARCVEINPDERAFLAPYPLLDLSSILYAKGYDPLENILPIKYQSEHNALSDVLNDIKIARNLLGY